jgi:hypothetical protein
VSHLADASIRAGDEPGLTETLRYLGSESELSAIGIGAYFCLHRFFNEVSNAVLGPLLHISTSEVETIHPLIGSVSTTYCHARLFRRDRFFEPLLTGRTMAGGYPHQV